MKNNTSVEVKCECTIPFHHELVDGLSMLLSGDITEDQLTRAVPHRDAICSALKSKIIFIKIKVSLPVSKWRQRLKAAIRRILDKELVGTIKAENAVTLIML